jgi:hypothetical protein
MASVVAGCSQSYHSGAKSPTISIRATQKSVVEGRTVWIHARTANLTNIILRWKVTPSSATITLDRSRGNRYAKFVAARPGGYIVEAYAETNPGRWVRGQTDILVTGMSRR